MGTLFNGLRREWSRLTRENAELEARVAKLQSAAERVCWFDWSDNDPDAVAAIEELRRATIVSG